MPWKLSPKGTAVKYIGRKALAGPEELLRKSFRPCRPRRIESLEGGHELAGAEELDLQRPPDMSSIRFTRSVALPGQPNRRLPGDHRRTSSSAEPGLGPGPRPGLQSLRFLPGRQASEMSDAAWKASSVGRARRVARVAPVLPPMQQAACQTASRRACAQVNRLFGKHAVHALRHVDGLRDAEIDADRTQGVASRREGFLVETR